MRLQSSLVLLGLAHSALALQHSSDFSTRDLEHLKSSIEARSIVDDIWDAIKDAATCTGCQAALVLLKGLAALGDKVFVETFSEVCKISGVEDDDVCEGAVGLEGPIIADGLRSMDLGSKNSKRFCITFLGLCGYPDVDEWDVPFPADKPDTSRPQPGGKDPIKIVHYSDIHIDPFYVEGSSTDCSKPICCRPYTEDDEPGKSTSPAGPNGAHSCDAPHTLEKSMYEGIKNIVPDAAFTIFTGDIIEHAVWNTSQNSNEAQIKSAYAIMGDNLDLVYGVAGNHETSPTNSFQPSSVGNDSSWIYELLSREWSDWVGAEGTSQAEKAGSYSAKYPGGNLRIISLNTNLYYSQNYWLYQQDLERDINGQIAWLVKELDVAEKAGENVYIIGHTPLGSGDAFHDGSNYLDQVVNRYSATIAAMFFGHSHVDQFQLSYSDSSDKSFSSASMMSYIGPSLTPTSGMPSFRVYEVDPDTFGVLDSITYMADMSDAAFQTTGPVWKKYYSAKEAYGPLVTPSIKADAELTPAFWHNVTNIFDKDADAFQGYISRKSRGWKNDTCDGDCKTKEICGMRAARAQDNCVEPEPGVHFGKRALSRDENRDECGISVSRATLNSLAVRKDLLDIVEKRFVEKANEKL